MEVLEAKFREVGEGQHRKAYNAYIEGGSCELKTDTYKSRRRKVRKRRRRRRILKRNNAVRGN